MSEGDLNDATYVSLLSKALTGIISLCVTISIAISGFALKESYGSSLMLRELSVRMQSVEIQALHNTARGDSLSSLSVEVKGIKDDIGEIKVTLKEIARK